MLVLRTALRRTAGTVKHTEAEKLWDAMSRFTKDLTERNEFLRKTVDECSSKIQLLERRVGHLEQENRNLHLENGDLKRKVAALQDEVLELRAQNTALEAENVKLRGRVRELEENHV